MSDRYADLEIRILEKQPAGYPIEITFNQAQEFPRAFLSATLPLVNASIGDGSALSKWLFSGPALQSAWDQARGQHPLRRIRLRIDATAPELHAIPWELLPDAANEATPFSRYLAGQWIPGSPILKGCVANLKSRV